MSHSSHLVKRVQLHKPITFFAPITRVDSATRVVTGYCYTQPKVKGDKWNLKREALKRAAKKYMEMPAIRSMHRQDIAAGVGLSLEFDDKGCKIAAEIVDDQEWRKVEKKVYRGFSIGGVPIIARGNDVEEFEWKETSLVDRPADPGAMFTMERAAGFNPRATYDVLMLEDAPSAQLQSLQKEKERLEARAERETDVYKRSSLVRRLITVEHLLKQA